MKLKSVSYSHMVKRETESHLAAVFSVKWKRRASAPRTAPVENQHRKTIRILFFFSPSIQHFIRSPLGYDEHVRLPQTNVGLWTPTKTHSLSESIIQYVQSEITDDQKIGTTWCQEAPPSCLARTFQVKRAPAKKHLQGLPITSSNDHTGDKWRQ